MKLREAASLEDYLYMHYIVLLESNVNPQEVADEYASGGVEITNVFNSAIRGFSAHLYDFTIEELEADERVRLVEPDTMAEEDAVSQYNVDWGLDRLSSNAPSNDYTYFNDGHGSHVYVMDSGVMQTHIEFENVDVEQVYLSATADPFGDHGTSVAASVAGKKAGMARRVKIYDLCVVLAASEVANASEWIIQNGTPPYPVNMSFSWSEGSTVVDDAAQSLINAGYVVVCSAGNTVDRDLSISSPARVPGVFVVSGTAFNNRMYQTATEGARVDILAPAEFLIVPRTWGNEAYSVRNGTSYAAPSVTGALAMVLANEPNLTADQAKARIIELGESGVITDRKDPETINLVLRTDGIKGDVHALEDITTSINVVEYDPGDPGDPGEPTEGRIRTKAGVFRTKSGVLRTRLDT